MHKSELRATAVDGSLANGLPDPAAVEIASGKPRHFPCFDGLRAMSALAILLCHTAWTSGFTSRSFLGAYTSRLDTSVSVFFMISGFLMYRPFAVSHLSERESPNLRTYFQRRLLRIIPAYWLALTVLTYGLHLISLGPGWQGVAIHYLFLQIYFPTAVFYGITQAWTLCTEMAFYFLLPVFAFLVAHRKRNPRVQLVWELGGIAVLYAISIAFRSWAILLPYGHIVNGKLVGFCSPHCLTDPSYSSLLVNWLPAYLDVFGLGMLLAVLSAWTVERRSESPFFGRRVFPWASWAAAAAAFLLVADVMSNHNILYVVSLRTNLLRQALEGLIALLLLFPAVFGPQDTSLIHRLLRSWPLASIGVISYGVYLWHGDLITQIFRWTGWQYDRVPFWLLSVTLLAVVIPIASISYFGLERPLLQLKNRMSVWGGRKDRRLATIGAGPPPEPAMAMDRGPSSGRPLSMDKANVAEEHELAPDRASRGTGILENPGG